MNGLDQRLRRLEKAHVHPTDQNSGRQLNCGVFDEAANRISSGKASILWQRSHGAVPVDTAVDALRRAAAMIRNGVATNVILASLPDFALDAVIDEYVFDFVYIDDDIEACERRLQVFNDEVRKDVAEAEGNRI